MRFLLLLAVFIAPSLSAQDLFDFVAPTTTIDYDSDDGIALFSLDYSAVEDPTNPGYPNDTAGFQFAVAHDAVLIALDIQPGPVVAALNNGNGPDFFGANVTPANGPGYTVGVVYAFPGTQPIQLPEPEVLIIVDYEADANVLIGNDQGVTVPLTWTNTLGDPPADNVVVFAAGTSVTPDFVHGEVVLEPDSVPFIRGDANADGDVVGLVDGFFVLLYQFIPSSDDPPCFDSADADDSGSINGLVDGLYILNFQFVMGPPPPPPFTGGCGDDPTADPLPCDVYDDCP